MNLRLLPLLAALLLLAAHADGTRAADRSVLRVDFARAAGRLRPLHGINKGPLGPGGLLDLTAEQRALGVPLTRLHDCHWPNPDVVDMHAVFPNPDADPERPESYDFRLTDEYLAAVRATGARIVYRLGESIEHTSVKRFVHPPKDPERWARASLGIIRHYNEGWAGGFRHDIRYWEIWNEPENRPVMWTGTDADYFRVYETAARAIKARYPALKVGGPAVGNLGQMVEGRLRPSPFVTAFLEHCRKERLPLDFFSWHCYTDDLGELAARAREVRRLLDEYGFRQAESHLNEWNYLPGGSWDGLSRTAPARARQAFYERMAGAEGAAFIAAALLELQDAPVDECNLFHGEVGGFGLFNEHGVPLKSYHALRLFRGLLDHPRRVEARGAEPGRLAVGAGLAEDGRSAAVLVSGFRPTGEELRLELKGLPWPGATVYDLQLLDTAHHPVTTGKGAALEREGSIPLRLRAPAVALVTLRPAAVGGR